MILAAILIFQGCTIISFALGQKKLEVTRAISITDDLKISSIGAVYLDFAHLMKAGFLPASIKINFRSEVIYLDPLVVNDSYNADYVFITHTHPDHLSKPDIELLCSKKTMIVGPKFVAKSLKGYKVKRS